MERTGSDGAGDSLEARAWQAYLDDPYATVRKEYRYSEWSLMPAWLQQTYMDYVQAMDHQGEIRRAA